MNNDNRVDSKIMKLLESELYVKESQIPKRLGSNPRIVNKAVAYLKSRKKVVDQQLRSKSDKQSTTYIILTEKATPIYGTFSDCQLSNGRITYLQMCVDCYHADRCLRLERYNTKQRTTPSFSVQRKTYVL